MTKSMANALKAVAVLVCIAVVCVGLLAVCNMYFPKYVPTLDSSTAKLINSICPTAKSDDEAYSGKYIVMLSEDDYGVKLNTYNKDHKSAKAEILAVYGEPKGINAGAYIIECKATGRDSDVVMLTAFSGGKITGATVKKQGESYWNKLPADIFDKIAELGKDGGKVDLAGAMGKTGATVSLTAVNRAVNMSYDFSNDYENDIRAAISKLVTGEAKNG